MSAAEFGILTQLVGTLRRLSETPMVEPLPDKATRGALDDAHNALKSLLNKMNERHVLATISPSRENQHVARVLDSLTVDMAAAVVCGVVIGEEEL